MLLDLPLHWFIRFKNPLLQREVRARFRFRRAPFVLSLMRAGISLFACSAWLLTGYAVYDGDERGTGAQLVLSCLWIGGSAAIGLMSASSLSRERESGTWEGLRLALLPPWSIVRSKWLSALVTFVYYALPFLLLIPMASRPLRAGMPFLQTISMASVVAAVLCATAAAGLWTFWRCRNTATGVILTGLLVYHVAIPAVWTQLDLTSRLTGTDTYGYYLEDGEDTSDNFGATARAAVEAPFVFTTLDAWRTDRSGDNYSEVAKPYIRSLGCILFYTIVTFLFLRAVTAAVGAERDDSPRRMIPRPRPRPRPVTNDA